MTTSIENSATEPRVNKEKVDMWLMSNQKHFPTEKIIYLREKLYATTEKRFSMLSIMDLKDPTTILLVSIFVGSLGIDRFMLGDTGMGILKLLTMGCCGILTIIDWFSTHKKARELNYVTVMNML